MSARDYAMARLAAAQTNLEWCRASLEGVIEQFVDPDDDKKGKARASGLNDAMGFCHEIAKSIQAAEVALGEMDGDELGTSEDDIGEDDEIEVEPDDGDDDEA
jgi:hypothetical protein